MEMPSCSFCVPGKAVEQDDSWVRVAKMATSSLDMSEPSSDYGSHQG